jgi:transcriptional regulator with GAF, ATPase, and Fis domain
LSLADLKKMQSYSWPGNIRELENIVERAVIVSAAGKLHIEIPAGESQRIDRAEAAVKAELVSRLVLTDQERRTGERENIFNALRQTQGKVAGREGAAALLGMKPASLYSRLRRWDIDARTFKPN